MHKKKENIGIYLGDLSGSRIRLSYKEIEGILGFSLPASAYRHKPWWGNGGHVQADAWLHARVSSVELGRSVEFLRET